MYFFVKFKTPHAVYFCTELFKVYKKKVCKNPSEIHISSVYIHMDFHSKLHKCSRLLHSV